MDYRIDVMLRKDGLDDSSIGNIRVLKKIPFSAELIFDIFPENPGVF